MAAASTAATDGVSALEGWGWSADGDAKTAVTWSGAWIATDDGMERVPWWVDRSVQLVISFLTLDVTTEEHLVVVDVTK